MKTYICEACLEIMPRDALAIGECPYCGGSRFIAVNTRFKGQGRRKRRGKKQR